MKKTLIFIVCLLLVLSASACKSLDKLSNDSSSHQNSNNSRTLIRALTGSESISAIEDLSILHEYHPKGTQITDSNDWAFFGKYVYINTVSADERGELLDSQKTNLIKIGISEQEIYLLKDGSIIIQEMCGDSGVKGEDRSYEVYKADKRYMLDEERLIKLLKKYNGYDKNIK